MNQRVGVCVLLVGCLSGGGPTGQETFDSANSDTDVEAPASWRSALYPPDWAPAYTDPDGHFLHDFSYAGYHADGSAPPATLPQPIWSVLDHGADPTGATDSTAAVQDTLDAASAGGTILLPAGHYRIDGELVVSHSGVVVAGEGADATFVHLTKDHDQSHRAGLWFQGSRPPVDLDWPLAVDGASRSMTVRVQDPSGLQPGASVAVGWVISDAFVGNHGMTGTWSQFNGQWRPFFRRTVVAVDGDQITLDVPLRSDALVRDQASLRPDEGYLTEVGLQDMSVSTQVDEAAALASVQHHAVAMVHVMDGWIRGVRTFDPTDAGAPNLQSGGLLVQESRRVTIADVVLTGTQNHGDGGNGYLVEIMKSGEVLVRDTTATDGRHNFIQNWDFGTTGCVFLRTMSAGGVSDNGPISVTGMSEFHHSLAMANLIDDSRADDGWQCVNRHLESSGAGHAGTENVFWNLGGAGTLRSMQVDVGYVVGTGDALTVITDPATPDLMLGGGGTAPADWAEGLGQAATLEPQSLYEDQLRRRLP
jgi:hypothetical protein